MTDQTPENPQLPDALNPASAGIAEQLETMLDLDTMLSSARLVERRETICLRGDLAHEYEATIEELATLVDSDGNVVTEDGDASLADGARAEELRDQAAALKRQMAKATYTVLFRAMDSDEWEAFEKSHRDGNGRLKKPRAYENELVARCSANLPLTAETVDAKLRKKVNQAQFVKLFNAAYYVNTQDGLDVPKSPSFSLAPRQSEQEPS